VQKTHSAVVSAAQLLEHVQTFTRHRSGGSSHPYPLLLCLFFPTCGFCSPAIPPSRSIWP
jgi:hypothetical protein